MADCWHNLSSTLWNNIQFQFPPQPQLKFFYLLDICIMIWSRNCVLYSTLCIALWRGGIFHLPRCLYPISLKMKRENVHPLMQILIDFFSILPFWNIQIHLMNNNWFSVLHWRSFRLLVMKKIISSWSLAFGRRCGDKGGKSQETEKERLHFNHCWFEWIFYFACLTIPQVRFSRIKCRNGLESFKEN